MARKRFAPTSLSAALAVALLASDSRAGATVDLLFVGHRGAPIAATDTIAVLPGDTLNMVLVLSTTSPLFVESFSLHYDLDGQDELDPLLKGNWGGVALNPTHTARYQPFTAAFSPTTPTFVGSWQSGSQGSPLLFLPPSPAGGYVVGSIFWRVNTPKTDGQDILSGLFNPGVDGFGDNNFNLIDDQVLFHGATVNAIPEPGTAALLGLGLLGLVLAARRRRIS